MNEQDKKGLKIITTIITVAVISIGFGVTMHLMDKWRVGKSDPRMGWVDGQTEIEVASGSPKIIWVEGTLVSAKSVNGVEYHIQLGIVDNGSVIWRIKK